MMAVRMGDGLIAAHTTNGRLDFDSAAGKAGMVGDIIGRSWLTTRFAAGRSGQPLGMKFVNARVSQVAQSADAGRQAVQQVGLFQQLDVGGGAGHTVGHIGDLPTDLVDGDLAF
jgi:hypothetical protein